MNIAVTGGMGSGKSLVVEALAKMLGVDTVSADALCKGLLEPGQAAYEKMRKQFSSDFFLTDGELNRPYLRKAIFTDDIVRKTVEDILHPLVREEMLLKCKEAEKHRINLVLEVPLLFEKGWQQDFDTTLVVYADDETCLKRIVARDLVSNEDAKKGIVCQMSLMQKCKLADSVINNSGSFSVTLKKLEEFIKILSANKLFMRKCKE